MSSSNFGYLYDICASQFIHFDLNYLRKEAVDIWGKNYAIWERLDGAANGDKGNVGINMICLHRHLKLSKRTSPYSIIKELKDFFVSKIGKDIFVNYEFSDWQKQFPSGRFATVSHNYKNLLI